MRRTVLVGMCAAVGISLGAVAQAPADEAAVKAMLAAHESETRRLLLAHSTPIAAADAPYRAEDYLPLLRWVGGKRLIVVSEPTHAMHECRAENAKVVRALVERAGVRTLITEMGYAEGLELDGFVRRGTGDVDDIVGPRGGVIWNTVEEADTMRWIAGWNRTHPKKEMVRVAGMDIEGGTAAGPALLKLVAGLGLDAELMGRVRAGAEAADRMKGPAKAGSPEADRAGSAAYDAALVDLIAVLRALPAGRLREDALRSAISVRSGRRSAELRAGGPDGNDAGQRLREFEMARSALAIMGDSKAPAMIVTHTVHLRPGRLTGDKVQTLGYHLARAMGDRAFFLGEDYGRGSMRALTPVVPGQTRHMHAAALDRPMPGSMAAALGDDGPLLIDLRDPKDGSPWSDWLESLQATHLYLAITYDEGDAGKPNWTVPADAFDALIYVPKVTPLHPIGAPEYVP